MAQGVKFVRIRGRIVPIGRRPPSGAMPAKPVKIGHAAKKTGSSIGYTAGFALASLGGLALGAGGALAGDGLIALSAAKNIGVGLKRFAPNIKRAAVLGGFGVAATASGLALKHIFRRSPAGRLIRRIFD